MQIMHFILDKILNFLTYYTPFYLYLLPSYLISETEFFLAYPVYVKMRTTAPQYCSFLTNHWPTLPVTDDVPLKHQLKLQALHSNDNSIHNSICELESKKNHMIK